jgi:putative DNA methylase
MDFCYVWLRRLVGDQADGFSLPSSRSLEELTGNNTQSRGIEQFTDGLASVYRAMSHALKPGAPLAFTFHHNRIEPYHAVGVAILDAGLTCLATLPCPAEMGGSIHIHGTASSIVDTIFVCRFDGRTRRGQAFDALEGLAAVMRSELAMLRTAGMKPTAGDIRCMVFGHVTRYAIGRLRKSWDSDLPTPARLALFAGTMASFAGYHKLIDILAAHSEQAPAGNYRPTPLFPQDDRDAVSF